MTHEVDRRPLISILSAITMLLAVGGCSVGNGDAEPTSGPASTSYLSPPLERLSRSVGVANDIPRFNELVNPSRNTRSGFDYQFINWLGDNVEPPFNPTQVPLLVSDRVTSILNGSVDLVVNVLSITDEKKDSIGIIGPYLITQQGALTRISGPEIGSLDDFNELNICTIDGSTSELQLQTLEASGRITLTREPGNAGCADRLREGTVDVFSTDQLVLSGFAATYREDLVLSNFTFGSTEEYGIGYPKGDVALCRSLREAIRQFVIQTRWRDYFVANFPDLANNQDQYRPDINNLDECDE